MKKVEMSQGRLLGLIAAGALLGSIAGSVGLSFADNIATTSTVLDEGVIVPYDGYLMLDSAPVNQVAQNLRFSLYESASGGTAQWVETQAVDINGGRFSAALGKGVKVSSDPANATFSEVILDAEKLYIGVEVDDGTGNFIELAGRQAIEATPFAAWAATSADFNVENNLTVESNAQVGGNLGVTNDVNVGGTANVNNLTVTGATSFSDVSASGTLTVAGATSLATASTSGDVTVGGVLTASQGIALGADQDITGADIIEGVNDLRLFSAPNSPNTQGDLSIGVNRDVAVAQDLTVGENLTVNGRINTACPGSVYIEMTRSTSAGQTRLCVYADNTLNVWENAAESCWDNFHGSDLCSVNQMAMLTQNYSSHNTSLPNERWLADGAGDNAYFYINRSVTSATDPDRFDFDGIANEGDSKRGYCCLKMVSYH